MATQIKQFRPLLIGPEYENKHILLRINLKWILQRIPMLLFALVSSYGVGHLLNITGIPFPVDYMGAISFDIGFLGTIALADMQLSKDRWSVIAYYVLNSSMALLAALFNVLAHANGLYANVTAEDITVGIPFAIIGLAFAFYFHSVMSKHIEAQQIFENATKIPCDYCGEGKPSKQAVYGHYRSCTMKKQHDTLNDPSRCKCKKCIK